MGLIKRLVRENVGLWPAHEIRNKALGWPRAAKQRSFEHEEIARLRTQVALPAAQVLVVIPTYKRPDTVRDALQSVLAQTYRDWVAIVVDDGGGLPDLPASDRVAVVTLQHNTGVLGVVRNIGMSLGESRFVAFLDDDNQWLSNHLSTTVPALEADPQLMGVYTSLERRSPDGSVHDVYGRSFDRTAMKEVSLVDANALVIRRSARRFSRVPRSRETLPAEDWEFVWRLTRSGPLEHIPEVTVRYQINPLSYYTVWDGLA